jgi:DNA-binding response OmpR family regulator
MPKFHSGAVTALVVDDEIPLLQLLGKVLEEAGFTPTCFGLGAPALAALAQHRFDLMVIDIGLPDMNGMQICESARERYGADVAILIITADNRRERCITALELGADDFVSKPFDVEELMARISSVLRRTTGAGASA